MTISMMIDNQYDDYCKMFNTLYKAHQITKLEWFLSRLAVVFPNPLKSDVKLRMKM